MYGRDQLRTCVISVQSDLKYKNIAISIFHETPKPVFFKKLYSVTCKASNHPFSFSALLTMDLVDSSPE
jgi:hypothetical protein